MSESVVDTKMLYWREIKTPAHPRHCQESPKVKFRPLSLAISLLSPAPVGPEIQITGAQIVNLDFPTSVFRLGISFFAPFPDHCLLVSFNASFTTM